MPCLAFPFVLVIGVVIVAITIGPPAAAYYLLKSRSILGAELAAVAVFFIELFSLDALVSYLEKKVDKEKTSSEKNQPEVTDTIERKKEEEKPLAEVIEFPGKDSRE